MKHREKRVPKRYVPNSLTRKDKIKQKRGIMRSQKQYKKGRYVLREKVKSFKSKPSKHIVNAQKLYNIDIIKPSRILAKKTKCNIKALKKIFKKGQGAYYSSGSRPNQTPHSWAYARLASSITGGKASAVDFKTLKEYCASNSLPLKLAQKSLKKYNNGKKKTPQVSLHSNNTRKKQWSRKYKASIDCNNPKGFSQKQFCFKKTKSDKGQKN